MKKGRRNQNAGGHSAIAKNKMSRSMGIQNKRTNTVEGQSKDPEEAPLEKKSTYPDHSKTSNGEKSKTRVASKHAKDASAEPKPAKVDSNSDSSESDETSSEEEEYIVEEIRNSRKGKGGRRMEYFIKWRGYGDSECTWEPEANLNCPGLLQQYKEAQSARGTADSSASSDQTSNGRGQKRKSTETTGNEEPSVADSRKAEKMSKKRAKRAIEREEDSGEEREDEDKKGRRRRRVVDGGNTVDMVVKAVAKQEARNPKPVSNQIRGRRLSPKPQHEEYETAPEGSEHGFNDVTAGDVPTKILSARRDYLGNRVVIFYAVEIECSDDKGEKRRVVQIWRSQQLVTVAPQLIVAYWERRANWADQARDAKGVFYDNDDEEPEMVGNENNEGGFKENTNETGLNANESDNKTNDDDNEKDTVGIPSSLVITDLNGDKNGTNESAVNGEDNGNGIANEGSEAKKETVNPENNRESEDPDDFIDPLEEWNFTINE